MPSFTALASSLLAPLPDELIDEAHLRWHGLSKQPLKSCQDGFAALNHQSPLLDPENEHIADLNGRELAIMAPLVAAIIWLGVYPAPVLRRMQGSAERFVSIVQGRNSTSVATTREAGR